MGENGQKIVCVHTQSCLTFCKPVDCSPPDSSAMVLSRQECWSGLPFPTLGDLPDPGIKPASPAFAGGFFTTKAPGKSRRNVASPVF